MRAGRIPTCSSRTLRRGDLDRRRTSFDSRSVEASYGNYYAVVVKAGNRPVAIPSRQVRRRTNRAVTSPPTNVDDLTNETACSRAGSVVSAERRADPAGDRRLRYARELSFQPARSGDRRVLAVAPLTIPHAVCRRVTRCLPSPSPERVFGGTRLQFGPLALTSITACATASSTPPDVDFLQRAARHGPTSRPTSSLTQYSPRAQLEGPFNLLIAGTLQRDLERADQSSTAGLRPYVDLLIRILRPCAHRTARTALFAREHRLQAGRLLNRFTRRTRPGRSSHRPFAPPIAAVRSPNYPDPSMSALVQHRPSLRCAAPPHAGFRALQFCRRFSPAQRGGERPNPDGYWSGRAARYEVIARQRYALLDRFNSARSPLSRQPADSASLAAIVLRSFGHPTSFARASPRRKTARLRLGIKGNWGVASATSPFQANHQDFPANTFTGRYILGNAGQQSTFGSIRRESPTTRSPFYGDDLSRANYDRT